MANNHITKWTYSIIANAFGTKQNKSHVHTKGKSQQTSLFDLECTNKT